MPYRAPIDDLLLCMRHVADLDGGVREGLYPDLADDAARTILTEAGAIAESVLAPLDRAGDREGATLHEGSVRTPKGWAEAYRTWCAGGWNGVSGPEPFGGMALPALLNVACLEIWSSANAAFALGPTLTMGAIEALRAHATPALQDRYLPKLVSGEWCGTMNLTEPQAGSDVGALRTRAEPAGDGTYRITGQKIFITYGDHDLTDNIIHLVLARLPNAPAGTRGISLFLVPKVLPDVDGGPGTRNDLFCAGLEHKLGMHASPTCTMVFGDSGGATGWLVGEANRGLNCMFTMMNNARLAIAVQGLAAAERATQQAIAFAQTRKQGRSAAASEGPSAIIDHPDVARMLLTMKAQTATARTLCHLAAAALDQASRSPDPATRRRAADRASLLTPVAKAYATDIGCEVASLGVQVHGGMGYIEDTGAAQILRDVRIASIYEGTNGIQAIDLATRKLALGDGETVRAEIADMREAVETVRRSNRVGFGVTADRLDDAIGALDDATSFMRTAPGAAVLAGATAYLRLFALARGGTALARMAASDDSAGTIVLCRFFAEQLCPAARGLAQTITTGAGSLDDAARVWSAA